LSTIGVVARGDDGVIRGSINTLALAVTFRLEKNPRHNEQDDNSPQLLAMAVGPNGATVPIGAVWARMSKPRNGEPSRKFYTMTLDDPMMPAPLHVTLFSQDDKPGVYDVVWRRAKRQVAPVAGDVEDAGEPASVNDEIPF
jgi:uncharacterized protein (DUF736 family)